MSEHYWIDGPHGRRYHCAICGISKIDDHGAYDCKAYILRRAGENLECLEHEQDTWYSDWPYGSDERELRDRLAAAEQRVGELEALMEDAIETLEITAEVGFSAKAISEKADELRATLNRLEE